MPSAVRFLLLFVGAVAAQSMEGDSCVTPRGKPGECRLMRDCPEMVAILTGRPSQEDIIYLNRARCGFEGSEPIVCCPGSGVPVTPSVQPPTQPPTQATGDIGQRDVTTHPKARLLPLTMCSPGGYERIFGGTVADVFAYPWIARLGYRSRNRPNSAVTYRCGGSLVNDRYVLTAAHCVTNLPNDYRVVTVRLGEHTLDKEVDCRKNSSACIPPPVDRDVDEALPHPLYDTRQMQHDIALIRLGEAVDFQPNTFVRPVCLPLVPENQNISKDGAKMIVAGWGTTETSQVSNELLEVVVPIVGFEKCRNSYTQVRITPNQVCAGGEQGRDSCTGDSGGPLMANSPVEGELRIVQFGVVSFGPKKCGTQDLPGIYTRVSHYMQWILDTIRE